MILFSNSRLYCLQEVVVGDANNDDGNYKGSGTGNVEQIISEQVVDVRWLNNG